jgi:hypothetical protein
LLGARDSDYNPRGSVPLKKELGSSSRVSPKPPSKLSIRVNKKKKPVRHGSEADVSMVKEIRGTFNRHYVTRENEWDDNGSIDDKQMMDDAVWMHFVEPKGAQAIARQDKLEKLMNMNLQIDMVASCDESVQIHHVNEISGSIQEGLLNSTDNRDETNESFNTQTYLE